MKDTGRIVFDKPAKDWNEALPVGNGRMGAMIYGGTGTEILQLNEDSIWFGGPRDRVNPSALSKLPVIRRALDEGRIRDAEDLCALALSGTPDNMSRYEALCNLYILFDGDDDNISDYERSLDIADSVFSVNYRKGDDLISREVIASYPDNVIAVRMRSEEGRLSFMTSLGRGNITWDTRPYGKQVYRRPGYHLDTGTVSNTDDFMTYLTGRTEGEDSVSFGCGIKVVTEGGTAESIGESIVVRGASEAVIYICATSTFYQGSKDRVFSYVKEDLDRAAGRGYEDIRERHVKDVRGLYDRVSLELPEDQWEYVRLFNFGRYLMIAGSRPGSQPLNLQGIWNKDKDPMWGSKYTININTQMNYWPAEACGLSECHLPLFDLIERMKPRGREVASRMYGARGFVSHHNTDIYGDCAPQDTCLSSTYWVMGAAWLCLHIMEHYEYTNDMGFLRELEAAVFLIDMSVIKDGFLTIYPTVSPENEYRLGNGETGCVCGGASMDDMIMKELFSSCLKAAEILGKEDLPETAEIRSAMPHIRPVRITEDGRIAEWHGEETETDPGHRHISHLFGLMPGHSINRETPGLMEAARKTLEVRLGNGGGHTGWSRAWIINLYARLGDGNEALEHLKLLKQNSLLPNLFDDHPPFQIDGNFGLANGILQMLVQCEGDDVQLLPALPGEWNSGSVRGLCIKGGKKIDMTWKDGKVTDSRIYS